MNIKISGASGYLGNLITSELKTKRHIVDGLKRELLYGPIEKLADALKGANVVVHLAGSPLLVRWTDKNKQKIIESRIATAQNIVRAVKSLPSQDRPEKVVSASGVSIYASGKFHTEDSSDYDDTFLSKVVREWEKAWEALPQTVSLTIFRMAVVLGKESPTIKTMLLPFKLGVGGKIGKGHQPFPFVHETDVVNAYIWAIENQLTGGIYNLAAPHQVSNESFTKSLAKALGRPAFMYVPPIALKLAYGEAAEMLTEGPSVYPDKLIKKGFKFQYPSIENVMNEIFNK